ALNAGKHPITAVYSPSGLFSASTSATLIQLVGGQNRRWVAQFYLDLLGREVDPTGLTYWTNALNNGIASDVIAYSITNSAEYHGIEVQQVYQQLLHRNADNSSLTNFVNFLGNGGTVSLMKAMIAGTPEYLANHGGTTVGFLSALFQDGLGRSI